MENLSSSKFLKFSRIFRKSLGKNLENSEACFDMGFGGRGSETSEVIKNFVENSMETCKFFENYLKLWEKFLFTEANLNKN